MSPGCIIQVVVNPKSKPESGSDGQSSPKREPVGLGSGEPHDAGANRKTHVAREMIARGDKFTVSDLKVLIQLIPVYWLISLFGFLLFLVSTGYLSRPYIEKLFSHEEGGQESGVKLQEENGGDGGQVGIVKAAELELALAESELNAAVNSNPADPSAIQAAELKVEQARIRLRLVKSNDAEQPPSVAQLAIVGESVIRPDREGNMGFMIQSTHAGTYRLDELFVDGERSLLEPAISTQPDRKRLIVSLPKTCPSGKYRMVLMVRVESTPAIVRFVEFRIEND